MIRHFDLQRSHEVSRADPSAGNLRAPLQLVHSISLPGYLCRAARGRRRARSIFELLRISKSQDHRLSLLSRWARVCSRSGTSLMVTYAPFERSGRELETVPLHQTLTSKHDTCRTQSASVSMLHLVQIWIAGNTTAEMLPSFGKTFYLGTSSLGLVTKLYTLQCACMHVVTLVVFLETLAGSRCSGRPTSIVSGWRAQTC
jgi:hypothetical protein